MDAALPDLEGDDPTVPDAFHQIATESRGTDAPDAIGSDPEVMAADLDRMADASIDVDTVPDVDSPEALEQVEGDLTERRRPPRRRVRVLRPEDLKSACPQPHSRSHAGRMTPRRTTVAELSVPRNRIAA